MKIKIIKSKTILGFIPWFYTEDSSFDTDDLSYEQKIKLMEIMYGEKL